MKKAASVTALLSLITIWAVGLAPESRGQKPPAANPQAPALAMPIPLGVQRGTSLDLVLTGSNLAEPKGLWTGFPAKITIPTDDKNGQDSAKLKVRLEVPADAPLGYHPIRLATSQGISNIRLFCVDDLPQVVELDSNRQKESPQPLPVPCVAAGRAEAESSDYFKITVPAGQRLSFDLLSRRLGSAMDPQITLYNAKNWREVAHNNDAPGCQTDARLSYTFKEAGDYVIEVRDVLLRGGADYGYRLRIGDFPLATVPVPMAAKRGSKVVVAFAGPAVDGVPPVAIQAPTDPAVPALWLAPKGPSGLHGWPVALALSNLDEQVEQEPNNEPAKANRMPIPGAVTGRFLQSDDIDNYLFAGKKGQKLVIEAHTLELYSSSLVYMVLKNAKTGAELAKSNPQGNPPTDQRIEFTPAADEDCLLEVTHLNFVGGSSEAYRLTFLTTVPGFDLALGTDTFDLASNAGAAIPVQAIRKGYSGPIDLSLVGPAGLSGTAKLKEGKNATVLLVTAKPDMPMGPYLIQVKGTATIDGKPVTEYAGVRTSLSQSLANLTVPPLHLYNQAALAVREKSPFILLATLDRGEGVPGIAANVLLTVKREAGFDEEIVLNPPTGLPPNVPVPKVAPIPKGKNEAKIPVDLNAKTPVGDFLLTFSGKGKVQKKEYLASAVLPLTVGSPFDLKVEPGVLKLAPGGKGKLKITATRLGGYNGPIALDFRKLPANVTADKAAIAQDKTEVDVIIAAAAAAAPGDKTDVDVEGTATAVNNLKNASPVFTISVSKK